MIGVPTQKLVLDTQPAGAEDYSINKGEYSQASKLARLWKEPDIEENLKLRINYRRGLQNASNTEAFPITEEMLVSEYYTAWAENFASKDPAKLIINHPGLLREDFDLIQKKMSDQTQEKLKWGSITTACVFGVYSMGLKNHWIFYNFFRRKHRFRAINWAKRFVGVYAVYLGCLSATNYIINQQFQVWLESSGGLIEKYQLQYYMAGKQ